MTINLLAGLNQFNPANNVHWLMKNFPLATLKVTIIYSCFTIHTGDTTIATLDGSGWDRINDEVAILDDVDIIPSL